MAVKKDLNQLKTQLASKTPTAAALNDTTSGYTAPSYSSQPSTAKPTTKTNLPTLNASQLLRETTPDTTNKRNEVTAQAVGLDTPSLGLGTISLPKAVDLRDTNYITNAALESAYTNGAQELAKNIAAQQANADKYLLESIAGSVPTKETAAAANKQYNNGITPQDTQNRLLAQAAALFANQNNQQFTQEDTAKIISGDYSPLEDFYGKRYNGIVPFDREDFGKIIKQTNTPNNVALWGGDAEKIASALMNAYYQTNGYPSSPGTAVSPAITYDNNYNNVLAKNLADRFNNVNLTDARIPQKDGIGWNVIQGKSLINNDTKTPEKESKEEPSDNPGSKDEPTNTENPPASSGTGGGYGIPGDIGQYLLDFSDKYYKESQKYLDEVMETMKKEGKNQQNQLEKTLGETLFDLQRQRAANNAAAFTTNANVGALTAGNVQADQASARELSKSADTYYNNLQTLLYQLQSSKNNWSTNRWGWIYDALGDYMYGAQGSQAAAQAQLQGILAQLAASKELQAEQNKWIESHPEFYSTQS